MGLDGSWEGRAGLCGCLAGEGESSVPGPSSWQMLANLERSSAAPRSLWQKIYGNERRRGFNLENAFVVRYPHSPTHFQSRETNSQTSGVLNQHPPCLSFVSEELARASTPPLSILYLRFTERSLGTHHTKISTRRLIAQRGGSTIALELHIVLTDRQPRTERAAETNILITHGREGIRGGLAQVLEQRFFHS